MAGHSSARSVSMAFWGLQDWGYFPLADLLRKINLGPISGRFTHVSKIPVNSVAVHFVIHAVRASESLSSPIYSTAIQKIASKVSNSKGKNHVFYLLEREQMQRIHYAVPGLLW